MDIAAPLLSAAWFPMLPGGFHPAPGAASPVLLMVLDTDATHVQTHHSSSSKRLSQHLIVLGVALENIFVYSLLIFLEYMLMVPSVAFGTFFRRILWLDRARFPVTDLVLVYSKLLWS
jgi:hypothetical protein